MRERPFQYRLWDLLLVVAASALVFGAVQGGPARALLVWSSAVVVLSACAWFVGLGMALVVEGADSAARWAWWCARLPFRLRQLWFERRLARLRPGNPTHRVRSLLGQPRRIEGFGDRLYWSYRVGGQRYTVSFDPRKLLAKYSNGLSRDLPAFKR